MSLSKSTEPKKQGKNKQTAQKPPNPKSPAKKDSIKLKINNQVSFTQINQTIVKPSKTQYLFSMSFADHPISRKI